ncbi:MAG: sialate O-acetylesterase, partial [Verrucomicrobiota bacterium]
VLAPIFRDGAVLQREKPVPVWGTAAAGEVVRLQFGERKAMTKADATGQWRVALEPMAASATPTELVVEGRNTLRVANVLVGEVWLCAGQSNMGFRVSRSHTAKVDVPAANFPLIRQYDVPTPGEEPRAGTEGKWSVTSPEIVRMFSATGYYFAVELHRALGVPIGFIRAAVGGTRVEAWMEPGALASDPAFQNVREAWQQTQVNYAKLKSDYDRAVKAWEADPSRNKPKDLRGIANSAPGALFEGMVRPSLPYALRGILWYQGESNYTKAAEYRALFPAMIRQWREAFGQGELPFYFVQLPNYEQATDITGQLWAYLREA